MASVHPTTARLVQKFYYLSKNILAIKKNCYIFVVENKYKKSK